MDKTHQQSLHKNDLLSLAQNMTKSKLISKSILKHPSNQISLKKANKETTPPQNDSNLLYSNIVPTKERSRSVNQMMSSLLKQTAVITEPTPSAKPSSKNVKKISSIDLINNNNSKPIHANTPLYTVSPNNMLNNNSFDNVNNEVNNVNNDNINEGNGVNYYVNNKRRISNEFVYGNVNVYENVYQPIQTSPCDNDVVRSDNNHNRCLNGIKMNDNTTTNANGVSNGMTQRKSFMSNYSTAPPNTSVRGRNFSNITSTYNNYSHTQNNIQYQQNIEQPSPSSSTTTVTVVQLEDIIVLEEKLSRIYESFKNNKPNNKFCIEWWTFYTYSNFSSKFENLFPDNNTSKQTAHDSTVLELLSIILIYELLKDSKISNNTLNYMKNLLNEIHQNFLIVADFILTRIITQSLTNMWINRLQNIILSKRTIRIYKNEHLNIMKKKNDYITSIFKNIMRIPSSSTHKSDLSAINFYFKKIQKTSIKSLNDYFRKKINQDYSKKGESISFIIADTHSMPNISVPYLQKKNDVDKFTLVLDLDETLISFKREDAEKGLLKLRPGLNKFLKELKPLYELIIFTAGTQEYADPILDTIEKEEKYFDKRLYRHHAVIIENLFAKDLSKLGRDLSKVIIIDNMPHNFRLQKENGIFIKNFYGEEQNDTTLLDLIPILQEIASDPNNDVRKELKKMENEIFSKITTDMK